MMTFYQSKLTTCTQLETPTYKVHERPAVSVAPSTVASAVGSAVVAPAAAVSAADVAAGVSALVGMEDPSVAEAVTGGVFCATKHMPV